MYGGTQLVVVALWIDGSKIKYGVAIDKVQEIIRIVKAVQVQQLPDYIRGIINLRGDLPLLST